MNLTPKQIREKKAKDYAARSLRAPSTSRTLFLVALIEGELAGYAGAIEYLLDAPEGLRRDELIDGIRALAQKVSE